MFALVALGGEPGSVNLKVEPELGRSLIHDHPAVTSGYHMDKRHWFTVQLDGSVPEDMLASLVEDSYDLVVSGLSRKARTMLGPERGPLREGRRPHNKQRASSCLIRWQEAALDRFLLSSWGN